MAAPAAADTGGPHAGEDDYDVVILGAGPAGAAAAITLRRHTRLRVALVERRLFDPFRPGETVSAALFPLVDYLGIARARFEERHLQSYAHAAAWGGDALVVRDFLFNGQGSGLHLDRLAFDSMLLDEAGQLGARIVQPAELLAITAGERWSVALRQGERKRTLSAAYVIDCSGRSSVMVRQQQCAVLQTDRMVGVYAYYDAVDGRARLQRTLVETTEHGWFYLAPLPGGRTAVAFMTDAETLRTLDLLDPEAWRRHALASTHIGALVRELAAPQAFRQYPVHSRVARLPANAAWTAAGDAAASFDPVSSLGIGHALSSGIHAARVAHAYLEQGGGLGEGYRQSLLDHFQSYVTTRRSLYANEQRWPGAGFWQRRAGTGAVCAQGQDGSRTRPNPGLGPAAGSSEGVVRTRSTSIK
ncbi:FAD-dependent oxidoreductase [Massilia sp. CCM 8733]|uniref:FAD-dependent oxidoreductase n=1 Tax=Massilia mucilaginosa TaxID=2609282 RepID=A0ABX0NNV3_9BURK|nr:FAD-dependent monooxygenase [Massilia mucilaginosa]NHZ88422.1 FAD-dependent oxidoreductase [Massilia mucilaginosa]